VWPPPARSSAQLQWRVVQGDRVAEDDRTQVFPVRYQFPGLAAVVTGEIDPLGRAAAPKNRPGSTDQGKWNPPLSAPRPVSHTPGWVLTVAANNCFRVRYFPFFLMKSVVNSAFHHERAPLSESFNLMGSDMPTRLNSRSAFRFGFPLFFAGLLGGTLGCGDEVKLVPVTGRVTVDGKPLTAGWVCFKPDKSKGNTFGGEPLGEVNSQGEYTLSYLGRPGAPLGAYKVTVTSTGPTNSDNTSVKAKNVLRSSYFHADTTPLAVEVVSQPSASAYDLKLAP
jgi:hypothetical protein